ncbi:MAG: sodium-dependent transporter [Treponema sp.]|nr:sodium-dependent transporter [Treponema sp.]
MSDIKNRETLGTRLGFLLLSAGCAIGLGNVWRFPYITGIYGGASFVLIYLVFLIILGLPVMLAEFAIGRASRRGVARAFKELEPQGKKWHIYGNFAIVGNYLLMMFYTVVAGWFLKYFYQMASGQLSGITSEQIAVTFKATTDDPRTLIFWMALVIVIGFGACFLGLKKGVERITKIMMSALFVIMIGLAVYSGFLPGASSGYKWYLMPDFGNAMKNGPWPLLYAAMGQAFFTLSLGIGSMEIFGSYIGKDYSLTGESLRVIGLDTFVAIFSGLIIFPACSAFGVEPSSGPGLVFLSLPNVFNSMGAIPGRIFGTLFFLFMSFAALSTVIAVFENIVAFPMDKWNWSRKKSVAVNFVLVTILSIPCALGLNIWSKVKILGLSIDGFEDFLVSQNLLPLGSLIFILFCSWKYGWGWDKFIAEVNTGKGVKFPNNKVIKFYIKYIAPLIIIAVFIAGYIDLFGK